MKYLNQDNVRFLLNLQESSKFNETTACHLIELAMAYRDKKFALAYDLHDNFSRILETFSDVLSKNYPQEVNDFTRRCDNYIYYEPTNSRIILERFDYEHSFRGMDYDHLIFNINPFNYSQAQFNHCAEKALASIRFSKY